MSDIQGDGINLDMPQDIPVLDAIANFTKCVVYVRPTKNWKKDEPGENFGFDWMRISDSEVKGDVKYADNMGVLWLPNNKMQLDPNSTEGTFEVDDQLYKRKLNSYFRKTYNVMWKVKPTTGKSDKDVIKEEAQFKYYVPVLNIMNGQKANLQLIVDTMDDKNLPQSIECRIPDKTLLSVVHKLEPKNGKYECTLTCNSIIRDEQVITFVAIYPDASGTPKEEICGFLKVLPNNNIKKLKVLFVDCTFRNENKDRAGVVNDTEISYAEKILNQGLVELDYAQETYIVPPGSFTETVLITGSSLGHFTSTSVLRGNLFYNMGSGLYEHFRIKKILEKYQYHIVVVAMGRECKQISEEGSNSNTNGSTSPPLETFTFSKTTPPISYTPSASTIILFEGRNTETMIHEILHATGLLHSFSSLSPYVYKPMKTDNIMDYSHQNYIPRVATWQWQWEAIRRYVDNSASLAAHRIEQEQRAAAEKSQIEADRLRKQNEVDQRIQDEQNLQREQHIKDTLNKNSRQNLETVPENEQSE